MTDDLLRVAEEMRRKVPEFAETTDPRRNEDFELFDRLLGDCARWVTCIEAFWSPERRAFHEISVEWAEWYKRSFLIGRNWSEEEGKLIRAYDALRASEERK